MRISFSMLAVMMALTAYSQDTTNYYKSARLKENAGDNLGAIADFTQYVQPAPPCQSRLIIVAG